MALQKPKRGYRFTFGYGSNMCLGRMRCRVPSACPVAVVELRGYRFAFHKTSTDRSGKADAFRTGRHNDRVFGVVFELHWRHMALLDKAEGVGKGYRGRWLTVNEVGGDRTFKAKTYVATRSHIDAERRPYSWYKRHTVEGGAYFKLDQEYIATINAMDADRDPQAWRERRELRFPCDRDVDPAEWDDLSCADLPPRPCE